MYSALLVVSYTRSLVNICEGSNRLSLVSSILGCRYN